MPSLGDSQANILIKTEANNTGISETKGHLDGLKGSLGGLVGAFALGNIASNVMMGATAKLSAAFSGALQANKDWQTQQAILTGQLKLAGVGTGLTKDSMIKLAEATQKNTAVSREAALAGINQLTTFQAIGSKIMPQTEDAVTRLASAMASGAIPNTQQMTEAAKGLGIAMDNPSKGYARLHRNGVDFSADQVAQIKQLQSSGNLFGAQQIILKGVSEHYTSLHAQTGTYNFQVAQLHNTVNDLVSKGLEKLKSILGELFTWWQKHEAQIKHVADQIINFLKPNFEALMHTITQLMPTLKILWNDVLKPLAEVIGIAIVIAIKVLLVWWNLMLHVIIDLVNWGRNVGNTLVQAWRDIAGAWSAAVGFFSNIGGRLSGALNGAWNTIRSNVQHLINDLVGFFASLPDRAIRAVGNIGSRIGGDIKGSLHSMHIPGFAGGVQNFAGGLAVVGENGPELAYLPQGSSIYPNGTMPAGLSGGGSTSIQNLYVTAPNGATLQSILDSIDQDTINKRRGLSPARGIF